MPIIKSATVRDSKIEFPGSRFSRWQQQKQYIINMLPESKLLFMNINKSKAALMYSND